MSGKSYEQFCGLARALDVVGERWTLLIVRQLLIAPARFGQLRAGLPTIATNLLAERLKDLEGHGVIERRLDSETNAILYVLTAWGYQLREPVEALIRWSTPVMRSGRGKDCFDPHWMIPALHALLVERRTPATLIVVIDDTALQITVDGDGPHVLVVGHTPDGVGVLSTTAETVLALAAGEITIPQAIAVSGDCTADIATIHTLFGQRDGDEATPPHEWPTPPSSDTSRR